MKLNTHDRTPRPKNSKFLNALLAVSAVLIFGVFGLLSFACFYYAQSFIGGISVIFISILMTVIILIPIKDMKKAYIEIKENEIHVVDYYLGVKKEKHITPSDITSAEIHTGYSHKLKGYRFNFAGIKYIVFERNNKYLFKIIALPETEELFKQHLK